MSLVLSLDPAVVMIAGRRYAIPAQSLTLPDNETIFIEATPTGYAQTLVLLAPEPGSATAIVLVTTAGGNITNIRDLRQIAGTDGKNQPPPSTSGYSVASYSIVSSPEGVGTIRVALRVTLTAPLDASYKGFGFTYALADTQAYHPLILADNDASDTTTFSTTFHGWDPDQDYDIATQAVAIDGSFVPGTPLLLTPTTPSLTAQSVPTIISKVIIPKNGPWPGDENDSLLQSGLILARHFIGGDSANSGTVMGDDGYDTFFNHANMSYGVQNSVDASGDFVGSSPLVKNLPNVNLTIDASMQYGRTVVGGNTTVTAWMDEYTGMGGGSKYKFGNGTSIVPGSTNDGSSGSPLASISIVNSHSVYAASVLNADHTYTITLKDNAPFTVSDVATATADGGIVAVLMTISATGAIAGGTSGGGHVPTTGGHAASL